MSIGCYINVGKQPYEQVTVFLLDRPDAVAQPTDAETAELVTVNPLTALTLARLHSARDMS